LTMVSSAPNTTATSTPAVPAAPTNTTATSPAASAAFVPTATSAAVSPANLISMTPQVPITTSLQQPTTSTTSSAPMLQQLQTTNQGQQLPQSYQGQIPNPPSYIPSVPQTQSQSTGQQQQQRTGNNPAPQPRRLILESQKLINITINESEELTDFLTNISALKSAVLEHYGMETEKVQCQVVKNHLKGQVRAAGDRIYDSMSVTMHYDLERYMQTLFQLSFPSSNTALEQGFKKLKQSRSTMIQYGQKHIIYCDHLERNLDSQNQKWIEGLNSENIKQALLRGRFSSLEFQELLTYACELEHAGLHTQPQTYALKINTEIRGGADDEECEDQMGTGFCLDESEEIVNEFSTGLVNGLREEGARKRLPSECCFQCFRKGHMIKHCKKFSCYFCAKNIKHHVSLSCDRCPDDLIPFLKDLAQKFKEAKENPSRGAMGRQSYRVNRGRGRYTRGNRPFTTYRPRTNMMSVDYQEQGEDEELTEEELSYLV
jgi:hypothetical protein